MRRGSSAGWASLAAGAVSVVAIPIAVYLTRFSESYELLHAGFAIPIAAAFGFLALALARRARRAGELRLVRERGRSGARAGRVLGIAGLCLAAAAVVALAVYGLLEYAGTRD